MNELSQYNLPWSIEVIHGNAAGADRLGASCAIELNIPIRSFPANWSAYGRAAGPIRNRQMLDEKPDLVLAFHSNIEASKGTKDCITEAAKRGIPVKLVSK